MQTVVTLPILQTVSDTTTHYLGLQPNISGTTTAEFVNRNLSFDPSSNTLTLGVNLDLLPNAIQSSALADQAVTTSKIVAGAIKGNLIPIGAITGNLIPIGAIRGNNIVAAQITSNHIVAGAITGNLIPAGAVTTNHIVAGAVTSNLLSPNLAFSITTLFETANVFSTAIGGTTNIDILNNTVYFFSSNTTANVTFNVRGNSSTSLDSALNTGSSISLAILLKQGLNNYKANLNIDGTLISPYWIGNTYPVYSVGFQESIDTYTFNIIKTGSSSYTVLAANSKFSASYMY